MYIVTPDPYVIEDRFTQIKKQINDYILKKKEIPPRELFVALEREFREIEKIYLATNDKINYLHVTHNYYWAKVFQYLYHINDIQKALEYFILALSTLLKRHKQRPYNSESFDKMLGSYEFAIMKIKDKIKVVGFTGKRNSLGKFSSFIREYNDCLRNNERLLRITRDIFRLLAIYYKDKVDGLKVISYEQFKETLEILDEIKQVLDNLLYYKKSVSKIESDDLNSDILMSLSSLYESLYKLRKKQLHYLVKKMFFEKDVKKREDIDRSIRDIIKDMKAYSKNSLKYMKKALNKMSKDITTKDFIQLTLTLKELDCKTAKYYGYLYVEKDIIKAWKETEEILSYILSKTFKEGIPLSSGVLEFYRDEWALLYVFTSLFVVQEKVEKIAKEVSQEWERDIFIQVSNTLKELERLFKYEATHNKGYSLKLVTSSFSGEFSEYFIYLLIQEVFEKAKNKKIQYDGDFKDLLEVILSIDDKQEIKLNYLIEPEKPDIDILIGDNTAIFLKNTKLKRDDMKQISEEIALCIENSITNIFYGINFAKNIENIERIHNFFERFKVNIPQISIKVFNLRDIIDFLFTIIEKSDKGLKFSKHDFYSILEY